MRVTRSGVGAAIAVLLLVAGCTVQPSRHPSQASPAPRVTVTGVAQESPEHAAQRLLPQAVAVERGADSRLTTAALATSRIATLEPVILGYHDGISPVSVPWIVTNDTSALRGDLFAAMRPSLASTDTFVVPVYVEDKLRLEFDMEFSEGHWQLTGAGESSDSAASLLIRRLGPGTQVRRALLLPSGLIFDVGKNGSHQALLMATLFNSGPGVNGFDGFLPWDEVLTPKQLRVLLRDERKRPYVAAPGTFD